MVVADLHVHTDRSDGTLSLADVPAAANRAGLEAVAVTDHDRVHPDLDPVVVRDGVRIIHGIELRVETDRERIDLLGYGVDPTPELQAELDRLQTNRIERARAIVACVEDRLDVTLDLEVHPGVGRPHVARAIDQSPADYDYQGAFDHLIGEDGPCYVSRDIPVFERGRDLLADACAVVGLAHPLRYRQPQAALELCASLDAVERYYPYDGPIDQTPVDRAIEAYDLLATGGSDAHGESLGEAGLDRAAYRRLRDRIQSI